MRIGLDASGLPMHVAGAGRYFCGLIHGLARIDCRNEYIIFAKKGTQKFFDSLPKNFHLFSLPDYSRPARLLWQHFSTGRMGRQCGLDIWHGMHYSLPFFPYPMRLVSTFHDLAFFLHADLFPAIKRVYFQQTIRRAWDTADAVIAVSRSTADEAARCLGDRTTFERQRTHIIHSGLDHRFSTIPNPGEIARVKDCHALTSPYILFIGTLDKRKNLPLLIEAFQHLRNKHRDLILVLAGSAGNGHNEVAEAINSDDHSLRILGYIPDADVLPLYHGAELFVLPSTHEGFGFPLLEAMACGIPTLAADNSAMRELAAIPEMLCSGGPDVWAHKMEQLLFDQNLRRRVVSTGIERSRSFTWEQCASATLSVYEAVFDKVRAGSTAKKSGKVVHELTAQDVQRDPEERTEEIRAAVLRTLAYADLFDYPLRKQEVHDGLLECDATIGEVSEALMEWERRRVIEQHDGVFFLRDRHHLVSVREERMRHTEVLLQDHAWLLRLVSRFPGVRSVSLSGAAAFNNCDKNDDIDVFIIASRRRVWSVYAGLAILLKILGKRETICVNCLFDQKHLRLDDRDFFLAHQIAFLRLCSGGEDFRQFLNANIWIFSHLPQRVHAAEQPGNIPHQTRLQQLADAFLSLRVFDYVEKIIFALYRRRITLRTTHLGKDDIVVHPGQIRLFTNNHRHRIKAALDHRLQEIARHASLMPDASPALKTGNAYDSGRYCEYEVNDRIR